MKLLGLWDLTKESFTLGGMLNLIVEVQCRAETHPATAIDICLLWDDAHPLPGGITTPTTPDMTLLAPENWQASAVVASMMEIEGISDFYTAGSLAQVRTFVQKNGGTYDIWPTAADDETHLDHEYPSTLNIQNFFRKHGYIPRIKFSPGTVERARAFLRDLVEPRRHVIVHAKSDPPAYGERDTGIEEWVEFIRNRSHDLETVFVAIGSDDVEEIRKLPNVIVARDSGNDLPRDLALIQIGATFTGLASGPAQLAILGDRPYAVFKPIHVHPEFMQNELGDQPGFPFATKNQHFFRVNPTSKDLGDALDLILATAGGE